MTFAVFAAFDLLLPLLFRATVLGAALQYPDATGVYHGAGPRANEIDMIVSILDFSIKSQCVVLAVWFVFGGGRWPQRLLIAIAASAALRATGAVSSLFLGAGTLPLTFQSIAASCLHILMSCVPFVIWRSGTGHSLVCSRLPASDLRHSAPRHFSVAEVLFVTAFVGSVAAFTQPHAFFSDAMNRFLFGLATTALHDMAWATVYAAPVAWSALFFRGACRAPLLVVLLFTACFGVSTVFAPGAGNLWPFYGALTAKLAVLPLTLLAWRFGGYRLANDHADEEGCGRSSLPSALSGHDRGSSPSDAE